MGLTIWSSIFPGYGAYFGEGVIECAQMFTRPVSFCAIISVTQKAISLLLPDITINESDGTVCALCLMKDEKSLA